MKTYNEFLGEGLQGLDKILNLSKVRKFPERMYDIYDMSKNELGKFLNTWFVGKVIYKKDILLRDEMWTVKKVDKETADMLYRRNINPICIWIMPPTGLRFRQNEEGEDLYEMKAQIFSIDDSSFGIWWNDVPLEELKKIRIRLMEWINVHGSGLANINGEEFLDICVHMGADEDSKDYN